MGKSYSDIQAQIAKLQAQAASLRNAEVAEVIAKIKDAIKVYALTARDLFGAAAGKPARAAGARRSAKYADAHGNTWGGRGPRPKWLRDALNAGQSLESFAIGQAGAAAERPAKKTRKQAAPAAKKSTGRPAARKGVAGKRAKPPVKFRDDNGNTWTGRGSQPKWVRAALAGGASLDSLRVAG